MGRTTERGSKIKKHKWTRREDEALIAALTELCQTGWKRDNNIFRSGYTTVLEKELKSKLPGCNLKASPHIESRLKTLKRHCDAITDMKDAFGIEWRSTDSTLICYDDDVWEDWVKDHSDAKGLRNKPFPYYDNLCLIFGKNRRNHKNLEDTSDANKALDIYDTNEEENDNNQNNDDDGDEDEDEDDDDDDDDEDDGVRSGGDLGNKRGKRKGSWGLGKMFEALLKRHEEQFSLLVALVGGEVAADIAVADKRGRLNGELKRIPNLGLQARLRAASIIVGDPPKLDLFYSLSNEERKEWVSMLLSGLI